MDWTNEKEMINTISSWAAARPDVRLVLLGGSRAEPDGRPDRLSDYDIEVYSTQPGAYRDDERWIDDFGEILVRWPRHPGPTTSPDWITQLVTYRSGLRIDFQITSVGADHARGAAGITKSHVSSETSDPRVPGGYRIIIDKDGRAQTTPPSPFAHARPSPPDEQEFSDRVNAFFWDITYVAKAIRRKERNYARYMLDAAIRYDEIIPIARWYVGGALGNSALIGKYGRWLEPELDPRMRRRYRLTFAGSSLASHRRAMWAAVGFVRLAARATARHLGYRYPDELDRSVSEYLRILLRKEL